LSAKASRDEHATPTATLPGDVVPRHGSMQVEGDQANPHQLENRGALVGNAKLRDTGMLVLGDPPQVQLDNREAQVDHAEYV
ncbi:hypothetical protein ACV35N_36440, partial [Pseudomonas aeruginosa]